MPQPVTVVEFYFSFISLWSYVGSLEFQAIVKRNEVEVIYKPVDLLAVFAAGGGKPVKERPTQRQSYRLIEMQRWREARGIPLVLHPKFYPADPSLAHRVLLGALAEGRDVSLFVHSALKAVWADELDIADPTTIQSLADAAGLDGARLLAQAGEAAWFEKEAALTQEAIDRALFGAPFYFLNGEPFWGQDRLDMLETAIRRPRLPFS